MIKGIVLVSALSGIFAFSHAAAEDATPPAPAPDPLYASVNGKTITQKEFHGAYANYLRETYYHRQVPEGQLEEASKEVSKRLIDRILLLDEARKRGLAADESTVAQAIAGYEQRYASSPVWQQRREGLLPGLKIQLEEQDLLRQMDVIGHAVAQPTDDAVRAYYAAHPELFTEPEKQRVHTILLRIDPSSPAAQWDGARAEATNIVALLRDGKAEFEDLARLHSNDRSAEQGGDMGYVHRGMIPEAVQTRLDEAPLGAVSDPVDVLEGVAIFRVDERVPSKLLPYDSVAARAGELLQREQTEAAWRDFLASLRTGADIKILEAPATAKRTEEK